MRPADRRAALLAGGAALLVGAVPLLIGWQLLDGAADRLSLEFLTQSPQDAGRAGGIGPMLASTASVLALCLALTLPLGLGAALLLAVPSDGGGRTGALLHSALDLLGGVPSIVFGLFGNRFFCVDLGMGYSILSGSLTLSCMVLPLFVRSAELALLAFPAQQRLAAAALGLSQWGLVRRLLLPFAAPGIAAGLVLAAGRALAETAVLLFTAGYVMRWPGHWLDSGRTLAVHIYDLAMNVSGGNQSAAATAVVLLALSLMISAAAHGLAGRFHRG